MCEDFEWELSLSRTQPSQPAFRRKFDTNLDRERCAPISRMEAMRLSV